MALDRQKILNELGNVVNQLESADCGCMGKLFSNSGRMNSNTNPSSNGFDGGVRSCYGHHGCHGHGHGHNAPCAGEPYAGARHCMGFCDPPKLYADTYQYLNRNVMQPVVQEVYDDLKSINTANTVMNNPMASQMGLSQGNNPDQANMIPQNTMLGHSGGSLNYHAPNSHLHFGDSPTFSGQNPISHNANDQLKSGQGMGHGMGQMSQSMGQMGQHMGHMGHHIGQMGQHMDQEKRQENHGMTQQELGHAGHTKGDAMGNSGGIMAGMGPQIVNMMTGGNTRQNFTPVQNGSAFSNSPDSNQRTINDPRIQSPDSDNRGMANVPTENIRVAEHGYNNAMQRNMQHNTNPNQMGNMSTNFHQNNNYKPYGEHTAGITKFNQMFPGVMKNDLGFDPMAIAIQMNPANQQKTAMDTMQKMMMSNSAGINKIIDSPEMQPVVNTTNNLATSLSPPKQQLTNSVPLNQEHQQQQQPRDIPEGINPMPQQVYTATTGAHQLTGQTQQPTNGHIANTLSTVYESSEVPETNQQPRSAHMKPINEFVKPIYKEPILPADTSRDMLLSHHFKTPKYEYNTLGQPVQMVSAVDYQTLIPDLPQTVSGQVVPARVRGTVSKTALVGSRPVGKTPSRSQLHHLYNQYRGSQSFTQQNVSPSGYNGSSSEGRINVPQGRAPAQYIERVSGDTAANNQLMTNTTKLEPKDDQIGDVPAPTKQSDEIIKTRAGQGKTRNGLQDQVFSTYPGSAKWSFHGATPAPYSVGHRYRGAK